MAALIMIGYSQFFEHQPLLRGLRERVNTLYNLRGAKLVRAQFTRADLRDANLGPLEIGEGRYLRSDVTDAVLRYTDLRGADLRRARLLETDAEGANLAGARIHGAELG